MRNHFGLATFQSREDWGGGGRYSIFGSFLLNTEAKTKYRAIKLIRVPLLKTPGPWVNAQTRKTCEDIPANACSAESPRLSTGLSRRHSRKVTFSSPSLPAEIPRLLAVSNARENASPPQLPNPSALRAATSPRTPYSGQRGADRHGPPGAAAPRPGKAARRRSPPLLTCAPAASRQPAGPGESEKQTAAPRKANSAHANDAIPGARLR